MKKLIAILLRDIVDLVVWILVITAFIQHFVIGVNVTSTYIVMIFYVFYVMYRLHAYNMVIRKQDEDIKKVNERYMSLLKDIRDGSR